jgi:hypothetical protein
VLTGAGQTSRQEYEERHVLVQAFPAGAVRLLPGHLSPPGPVDEIPRKKYLLHMLVALFPQVRRGMAAKKI